MTQIDEATLALADAIQADLAEVRLKPNLAKLYSQFTKLKADDQGIAWSEGESLARLEDALLLVQVGLLQKKGEHEGYRDSLRRAAEILEWLQHPNLNIYKLPIGLLAAAIYQIAGYPARATGLLNAEVNNELESDILKSFLKCDFWSLQKNIIEYWSLPEDETDDAEKKFSKTIIKETVSALGIILEAMKWGESARLSKALEKLDAVSKVMIHDRDAYSWLLAKLCYEVGVYFSQKSLRDLLEPVSSQLDTPGKKALEKYIRRSYMGNKFVAWPSQEVGISALINRNSFALCTPTGSGKTTVAEIAIIQGLFSENARADSLILYLVPSRALAVEVESKLSNILRRVSDEEIIVTGLYGGAELGTSDSWLMSDNKAVLICTQEKLDALIRFLGTSLLNRITLVVLDEAHAVQFSGNAADLKTIDSRSLKLETLGMRIFTQLPHNCRVIALSAVVANNDSSLAKWIEGDEEANSIQAFYRSTRQLVGRLECSPDRSYTIRYDILDNSRLQFSEDRNDIPFIPNPFVPCPPAPDWDNDESVNVKMRPFLLWSALQIAASEHGGHSVLISITQKPEWYINDFWELLNNTWSSVQLPNYFSEPTTAHKQKIWERCLNSCIDYFGEDSFEYKLMRKGIIIHHGKMPGLLARCIVQAVQEGIASVVLATSTLSEGVNLPFKTVLIPSLVRWSSASNVNEVMPVTEFKNLIGRAGRPGNGTEGRALVLLYDDTADFRARLGLQKYEAIINGLLSQSPDIHSESSLEKLLEYIQSKWIQITSSSNVEEFIGWLEEVTPAELFSISEPTSEALDILDSILIAIITEAEESGDFHGNRTELEEILQIYWKKTYANFVQARQPDLERWFVTRGTAVRNRIYPEAAQRRKFYKTNLPPLAAQELLDASDSIQTLLLQGEEYSDMTSEQKFEYINSIVSKICSLPKYKYLETRVESAKVLRWWFRVNPETIPSNKQISKWHDVIRKNFLSRFTWGLNSAIALIAENTFRGESVPTLENWPLTGLPWATYWIKELIIWGTLDPVAACLLASGKCFTRSEAERIALEFHEGIGGFYEPNERLNPTVIMTWVTQRNLVTQNVEDRPPLVVASRITNPNLRGMFMHWRVFPIAKEGTIHWYDPAGFELAQSTLPTNWSDNDYSDFDFVLDSFTENVTAKHYLSI